MPKCTPKADARLTERGVACHHGHAMGDYSVALNMSPRLTAIRAANGATDPIRAYITIVGPKSPAPEGIYITATGMIDSEHGHYCRYDTSKGDYAAVTYAIAVIRKLNAEWLARDAA